MKTSQAKNISLLASAVLIFNLSSCKYEDGPIISLKTKKARLVGTWELKKVNGENPDRLELELEFEKDGDFKATYSYTSYWGYDYEYDVKGDWEWEDKKETIDIDFDGYHEEYEVKRLTSKELWIEEPYHDEWELEKK